MRNQLSDFKAKGFGTILIQCRLAFPRSLYLSDDFLDAYRHAVEIMAELGLVAGLYDDYNWNSGQAGGRTVEGADHLRERHLFWAFSEIACGAVSDIAAPFSASMGKDIAAWLYEGGVPRFDDWQLVSATVFIDGRSSDEARDVTGEVTLTAGDGSCEFLYRGDLLAGERLLVAVSARCITSRLPNYLLPEAGERFVEVGLEPYAQALRGSIPGTLAFLFYDQPGAGFYRWKEMEGCLGNSLLYSPAFKAVAESGCDRPFGTVLLALLTDGGPQTADLREIFYRAYSEQLNKGFFTPLQRFCRKHGLRLTGHEILPHVGSWALNGGFTSIDPRVAPAVDFFGIDAMRDETAVDANNFESQLSPKLGDSVARAHGRSRAIVELYATATRTERRGAGQWELSPATLRAQSIRLHLLGARQVIIHALYETDGSGDNVDLFVNPRFDFAPGLNFEPWWPHYRAIAEETARLSAFLETIVPETPVALFYPLDSAFVEGPRHAHASDFGLWSQTLDGLGCGYMIVDEAALEQAVLADDLLQMSGLSFAAVVLPSVTRLSERARQRLLGFHAAGGRLWASGERTGIERLGIACRFTDLSAPSVAELLTSLPASLRQVAISPVRQVRGWDSEGRYCCALFNESQTRRSVRLGGIAQFEVWNCRDGSIAVHDTGEAEAIVDLEGDALLCLRFPAGQRPRLEPVSSALVAPAGGERHIFDEGWYFRRQDDPVEQPISAEAGWQSQGHAGYSGIGIYTRRFRLDRPGEAVLELPQLAVAATVLLDGAEMGGCIHPPYRVRLGLIGAGNHVLELQIANTAANRYYASTPYAGEDWPDRSGLTRPPILNLFPIEDRHEEC